MGNRQWHTWLTVYSYHSQKMIIYDLNRKSGLKLTSNSKILSDNNKLEILVKVSLQPLLRLRLVGVEIRRMENKGKKIGERGAWLGKLGRWVERNFRGARVLFPLATKILSFQFGEKTWGLYFNPINYIFATLFVTLNMKISGGCWYLILLQPT